MGYLLLVNARDGNGGWILNRAETLEELAQLYRNAYSSPDELILAKELPLKLCDPDESTEVEV